MGATRDRGPGPEPGLSLAEFEAVCVWTAQRLRALTWAALVGGGYDPDVFDIALLTHRAARAGAAARRAQARPPAPAARDPTGRPRPAPPGAFREEAGAPGPARSGGHTHERSDER
jgi:hypothetical protein